MSDPTTTIPGFEPVSVQPPAAPPTPKTIPGFGPPIALNDTAPVPTRSSGSPPPPPTPPVMPSESVPSPAPKPSLGVGVALWWLVKPSRTMGVMAAAVASLAIGAFGLRTFLGDPETKTPAASKESTPTAPTNRDAEPISNQPEQPPQPHTPEPAPIVPPAVRAGGELQPPEPGSFPKVSIDTPPPPSLPGIPAVLAPVVPASAEPAIAPVLPVPDAAQPPEPRRLPPSIVPELPTVPSSETGRVPTVEPTSISPVPAATTPTVVPDVPTILPTGGAAPPQVTVPTSETGGPVIPAVVVPGIAPPSTPSPLAAPVPSITVPGLADIPTTPRPEGVNATPIPVPALTPMVSQEPPVPDLPKTDAITPPTVATPSIVPAVPMTEPTSIPAPSTVASPPVLGTPASEEPRTVPVTSATTPSIVPTSNPKTDTAVTPAALPSPDSTPVTSASNTEAPRTDYDVDLHSPRSGETFEAISRQHYGDEKYAEALRLFNAGRAPGSGAAIQVPPMYVLRRQYPQAIGTNRSSPPAYPSAPTSPPNQYLPERRVERGATPAALSAGNVQWSPAPGNRTGAYTVPRAGMKLWDVAEEVYGDRRDWERVWRSNPQIDPNTPLPEGAQLRLP